MLLSISKVYPVCVLHHKQNSVNVRNQILCFVLFMKLVFLFQGVSVWPSHFKKYADAIRFFASKCQKIQKSAKITKIHKENLYISLNHMMNFDEIFRKNVAYDNIKNHRNSGLQPFSRKQDIGKTTGWSLQTDPSAVSGLRILIGKTHLHIKLKHLRKVIIWVFG